MAAARLLPLPSRRARADMVVAGDRHARHGIVVAVLSRHLPQPAAVPPRTHGRRLVRGTHFAADGVGTVAVTTPPAQGKAT